MARRNQLVDTSKKTPPEWHTRPGKAEVCYRNGKCKTYDREECKELLIKELKL